MNHFLVKTEPEAFSWDDLVRESPACCWDGVRNYQARNYLRAMQIGDRVLIYHSVKERRVVGIARVTRAAYPDPTVVDDRWVAVDLAADAPLPRPVPLAEIKADELLRELALVRQSRLSVMPVPAAAYDRILMLGQG
ncbi:MAG: EVE domain-containing protein [Catalinimonas sp.]